MADLNIEARNFATAIKKMMKQNRPNTMIYGTIKTIDPLSIDIGNGIILPKEFLFLGQMCRPHKVKIPHTHQINGVTEFASASSVATDPTLTQKGDLVVGGQATVTETKGHQHDIKEQLTEDVHKEGTDFEEYVTIEIEPKLKVDDVVLMFAFNDYQKYYVAERIEMEG